MAINSRDKGARGERLFRDICRKHGFDDARRGQQYCGANGDADVVGLPNIHIECKYVENLNFHKAMEQSAGDAKDGEMPIVASKRKYEPWLITMRVDDWFELYEAWLDECQELSEFCDYITAELSDTEVTQKE